MADFIAGTHVLKTTVSATTKRVLAHTGDVVSKQITSENAEWVQHVGFVSIPSEASGKDAAQAFGTRTGDHDILTASQDARGLKLYGAGKPGETFVYAAGKDGKGQAVSLWKGDGSITHLTRLGNAEGATALVSMLDPQNDVATMANSLGFGFTADPDGVTLTVGKASLTLFKNGNIALIGTGKVQIDGSTIVLGSVAVPVVNSALVGATGLVGVASTKVFIAIATLLLFLGAIVPEA